MAGKGNQNDKTENGDVAAEAREIIAADAKSLRPSQLAVLELLHYMESSATEDIDAGGFFGDDIAAILTAETEAEMWEGDELARFNAKVLSGTEMELYGFDVKFSDSPEIVTGFIGPQTGRKMYLLVHASRLNAAQADPMYRLPDVGEEFVWNTSARFIVAKLAWLQRHGRFDNGGSVKVRIEGTDLGAGKSVEKLKELSPATVAQASEPPF